MLMRMCHTVVLCKSCKGSMRWATMTKSRQVTRHALTIALFLIPKFNTCNHHRKAYYLQADHQVVGLSSLALLHLLPFSLNIARP